MCQSWLLYHCTNSNRHLRYSLKWYAKDLRCYQRDILLNTFCGVYGRITPPINDSIKFLLSDPCHRGAYVTKEVSQVLGCVCVCVYKIIQKWAVYVWHTYYIHTYIVCASWIFLYVFCACDIPGAAAAMQVIVYLYLCICICVSIFSYL